MFAVLQDDISSPDRLMLGYPENLSQGKGEISFVAFFVFLWRGVQSTKYSSSMVSCVVQSS